MEDCWGDVGPRVWAWRPPPAAMHIRPLRGPEEVANQKIGDGGGDNNFMTQKDMKPPSADAVLCWIPAFAGMTFVRGNDNCGRG